MAQMHVEVVSMGLVKTRRLAAMQKMRTKAGAKKPSRPSEDRVRSAKTKRRLPAF